MRRRTTKKLVLLIAVGGTLLQLSACVAATAQLVFEQTVSAVIATVATQLATQVTNQITPETDPNSSGG